MFHTSHFLNLVCYSHNPAHPIHQFNQRESAVTALQHVPPHLYPPLLCTISPRSISVCAHFGFMVLGWRFRHASMRCFGLRVADCGLCVFWHAKLGALLSVGCQHRPYNFSNPQAQSLTPELVFPTAILKSEARTLEAICF